MFLDGHYLYELLFVICNLCFSLCLFLYFTVCNNMFIIIILMMLCYSEIYFDKLILYKWEFVQFILKA